MPDITPTRAGSCIFMLHGHGDLRIDWEETNRAEITALFQSMMDKGVSFFILAPDSTDEPEVQAIGSIDELSGKTSVYIKDPDISKVVEAGFARIANFSTTGEIRTSGTAKTAAAAAAADTVAVQPKKGG